MLHGGGSLNTGLPLTDNQKNRNAQVKENEKKRDESAPEEEIGNSTAKSQALAKQRESTLTSFTEAREQALLSGSSKFLRSQLMIVGQGRVGETSTFNTPSTALYSTCTEASAAPGLPHPSSLLLSHDHERLAAAGSLGSRSSFSVGAASVRPRTAHRSHTGPAVEDWRGR